MDIDKLKPAQRLALTKAKPAEGGGWWISERDPGYRGLPTLGLVNGRAYASRVPGTSGRLTLDGEKMRAALLAETADIA